MGKELLTGYYWDRGRKIPRLLQFKDCTIAIYTQEGVLSLYIDQKEYFHFYDNGQIASFSFKNGWRESYYKNGLLHTIENSYRLPGEDTLQKQTCRYTYGPRGRIELIEGIISSQRADGIQEELGRTFLDAADCPFGGKMPERHMQEIVCFLKDLPYTEKNITTIMAHYNEHYGQSIGVKVTTNQISLPQMAQHVR